MNLKKLYFVIKRFSILRATHFTYHFFILKNQLNSHFKNKLKSFQISDPGTLPEKYLDLSMWIFENLIRAFDANLDRSSDLRILDIGCGPGYFIYIANYFGHHAEGVDLSSNELYNFLIKELSISRFTKEIKSFEQMNLATEKDYDLISAYMICFDNHGSDQSWNKAEWNFFIEDLKENYLNKDGKIILGLNPDLDLTNREEVELFLKPWLYSA